MASEVLTYATAGALAGMRANAAPAAVAEYLHRHRRAGLHRRASWLEHPRVRLGLRALAALEMAGDKLPGAMARTRWPALLARIGSGAVCGAALATNSVQRGQGQRGWLLGATLAGVAAGVAAQASHRGRSALARSLPVADHWVGLAEDTLVLLGARALAAGRAGHARLASL